MRGFFGIGVEHIKNESNIGLLWRHANIFGASFIFTIGRRYRAQHSDTMKTPRNIPLYNYTDFDTFYECMPYNTQLIGVELHEKAVSLPQFTHPDRCIYLLGAEDHGLSGQAIDCCHSIVQIPAPNPYCMNVGVAGAIVMYARNQEGE